MGDDGTKSLSCHWLFNVLCTSLSSMWFTSFMVGAHTIYHHCGVMLFEETIDSDHKPFNLNGRVVHVNKDKLVGRARAFLHAETVLDVLNSRVLQVSFVTPESDVIFKHTHHLLQAE